MSRLLWVLVGGCASSPFYVLDTTPGDGSTQVHLEAALEVTFSENVAPETVSVDSLRLTPGVLGTWTTAGASVRFLPDTPYAYEQDYTLTITTSVASTDGVRLGAERQVGFTTRGPQWDENQIETITNEEVSWATLATDTRGAAVLAYVTSSGVLSVAERAPGEAWEVTDLDETDVDGSPIVAFDGSDAMVLWTSADALRWMRRTTTGWSNRVQIGSGTAAGLGLTGSQTALAWFVDQGILYARDYDTGWDDAVPVIDDRPVRNVRGIASSDRSTLLWHTDDTLGISERIDGFWTHRRQSADIDDLALASTPSGWVAVWREGTTLYLAVDQLESAIVVSTTASDMILRTAEGHPPMLLFAEAETWYATPITLDSPPPPQPLDGMPSSTPHLSGNGKGTFIAIWSEQSCVGYSVSYQPASNLWKTRSAVVDSCPRFMGLGLHNDDTGQAVYISDETTGMFGIDFR